MGEQGMHGNGSSSAVTRVFIAIAFALLALPLMGMPFFSGTADAEKREESLFPDVLVDGAFNRQFFSELETWYNDHFAFRTQLVDADSTLRETLFMESAADNVIVGSDGWLYYAGTLADYQRSAPMSDRALDNAAYNISLMQEYAERMGATFVFTIAPNKNSVYPEHMPYYEMAGEGASNAERIEPLLEQYGVTYVDLFEVLSADERTLYLHGDSHWTNEGALVGAGALAEALGCDLGFYEDVAPELDAHIGDLAEMLHPLTAEPEMQPLWPQSLEYSYTNGASGVEDGTIETASDRADASGSLMCYRDSFGNALIPYLASAYDAAVFSKMVPYDMHPALLTGMDAVLVERAERHLSFFATTPPYMPAPMRSLDGQIRYEQTSTTCSIDRNGPYLVVEGVLDERYVENGDRICVMFVADGGRTVFEAFHVSGDSSETVDFEEQAQIESRIVGDYGFRAYVILSQVPDVTDCEVAIIVSGQSGNICLYREAHSLGG